MEQQQLWDLNHLCFGHFGAERIHLGLSPPGAPRVVWVGTSSPCLCCGVAVFGMWGHGSFPSPAAAPFVGATKEAPFEFPVCTALMSLPSALAGSTRCALRKAPELFDRLGRRNSAHPQACQSLGVSSFPLE